MRVSVRAATAAAAVIALVGLAATPAVAATATSGGGASSLAYCQFVATIRLDPGLPYAGQVAFSTVDQNGAAAGHAAITCSGWVRGYRVLDGVAGGYAESGWTVGDCAGGSGQGGYDAWIPTVRGVQHLTGGFSLSYDGTPLVAGEPEGTGTESGENIQARFWFRPTQGMCTAEMPLIEFALRQEEVLTS
jgi:hypothetical protein